MAQQAPSQDVIQQMREQVVRNKRVRELKEATNKNLKKQQDREAATDYRTAQALMNTARPMIRNGTFAKAQRKETSKQFNKLRHRFGVERKARKRKVHREQEADALLLKAERKLRHEQKLDADQAARSSSSGIKTKQRR